MANGRVIKSQMKTDERPQFLIRIAFNFHYENIVILFIQNIAENRRKIVKNVIFESMSIWFRSLISQPKKILFIFEAKTTMTQPKNMCAQNFKHKLHIYQSQMGLRLCLFLI